MQRSSTAESRYRVLLSLFVLGLFAALFILPYQFRSEAVSPESSDRKGTITRTESHQPGIENFDIREQKTEEVESFILKAREDVGKTAFAVADIRDSFVRGEESLRSRVRSLKVKYNNDIRIPEVITPDAYKTNLERLSAPTSGLKNAEVLRNFAKQYNDLVGMDNRQLDDLKVLADYTNPSGNMSFAHLEQQINGIPVFRGEIKAGFTTKGEIIRVINNLAPGLDYDSLATDFKDPLDAVRAAARHINYKLQTPDITRNDAASSDLKTVFGEGDWATTAEKMYFPTEPGVARAAWRVLIWQPVNAYYVLVDAETGTMLWRKNITEDQTEAATYDVYTNPLSIVNAADSVAPLTPYTGVGPADGTQGALLNRTNVTLIGNEGDLSFNNNGWITDGGNSTDGNSNEAGVDLGGANGVDAPVMGTARVFSSAWNPPPGNPAPGDAPTVQAARDGAVIQMFYLMNRFHDELYKLGFTEQAFNFQDDNFGRGGAGGDRVSSEGQDGAGTNNANFSTPADGGRGRMQMFVFTGPTPDRDGTADGDIVIHEVTHGLSNRLHGNSAGLGSNMARGMGEGWSDWYAFALLSSSDDPVNGVYAGGGHVLLSGFGSIGTDNYYYGIRSFPKATLATTGGPNNRPHNPLTFADIDTNQEERSDGAFPPKSGAHISTAASQVHRAGEVWSSLLWEVRALMINRLGHVAGNQRAMQVVTDGMKLAPLNPTFVDERDAIIMAASALPAAPEASADVADVREGFRLRGMGFSAAVTACCGTTTTEVVEAFDFPNVAHIDPFMVSDSPGDADGFPEPGENLLLSIPVTNTTGATITNVMANVNGGTNVNYGDMTDGQTLTMDIPYTPGAGEACGGFHTVQVNVLSDAGAQAPVDRTFRLGAPVGGPATTFENTTPLDLPSGQPGTTSGPSDPYPSTIAVSGLSGNKVIQLELTNLNHTWLGDLDMLLEAPDGSTMVVMSDAFSSSNRTGTVVTTLTLRDDAADFMPGAGVPPPTGTFKPTQDGGTTDTFDAPAPAGPFGQPGPDGPGDTFMSVFGTDGSAMNGDWTLWIDDDAGGDPGTLDGGWKITFESDEFACSLAPQAPWGDFDGDGRTDVSVFRPSEGNWYINGSTDGFSVTNWGLAGDVLVPGDYDGDGKADTAIFRPSADENTPDFFVLNSNGFVVSGASWGLPSDIPVPGDYDGDGNHDFAVWRPSDTTFYIVNSADGSNTFEQFGSAGDVPMAMDHDGDGKDNLAVFRSSDTTWYIGRSTGTPSTNFDSFPFGLATDMIVPADYDGDGKEDVAVFRPSDGFWHVLNSSDGQVVSTQFGASGDIPVPGDYDGDGSYDQAVYRGSGDWFMNQSTNGFAATNFGLASDMPIPNRYTP